MTPKQQLNRNKENIQRYMEKMKAKGWKKYCFLVPHEVASEMYHLKDQRLAELALKQLT